MERRSASSVVVGIGWVVWTIGVGFVGIPYLIVTRTPDRLSVRGRFRLLGLPLVVVGAALYLWSTRTLTAPGGTPVHTDEPADLVTDGPYRYSRNPLYVSGLCIIAGEAILLGHLGVLAYAGLAWGYCRVLVGYEERQLGEAYGEEYEAYRRDVPRWIGVPERDR